jgi:hypothetical protein
MHNPYLSQRKKNLLCFIFSSVNKYICEYYIQMGKCWQTQFHFSVVAAILWGKTLPGLSFVFLDAYASQGLALSISITSLLLVRCI